MHYGIDGREFVFDWCGLRQSSAIKFIIIYVRLSSNKSFIHFDFILEVIIPSLGVLFLCRNCFQTDTDAIHIPLDDRLQSNLSSYNMFTQFSGRIGDGAQHSIRNQRVVNEMMAYYYATHRFYWQNWIHTWACNRNLCTQFRYYVFFFFVRLFWLNIENWVHCTQWD